MAQKRTSGTRGGGYYVRQGSEWHPHWQCEDSIGREGKGRGAEEFCLPTECPGTE